MRFEKSFIKDLVARTDLASLIGSYVPLKRASSKEMTACCPFHEEDTPSFTVPLNRHGEDQFFHCFGCQEHGNALDFIMKHQGVDFIEAVKTLCAFNGVPVPEKPTQQLNEQQKRERQISGRAFALTDKVIKEFQPPNQDDKFPISPALKAQLQVLVQPNAEAIRELVHRFKSLKGRYYDSGIMTSIKDAAGVYIPVYTQGDKPIGLLHVDQKFQETLFNTHPSYPISRELIVPENIDKDTRIFLALDVVSLAMCNRDTKSDQVALAPCDNGRIDAMQLNKAQREFSELVVLLPGNRDKQKHFNALRHLIRSASIERPIQIAFDGHPERTTYLFDHIAAIWPSIHYAAKDQLKNDLAQSDCSAITAVLNEQSGKSGATQQATPAPG